MTEWEFLPTFTASALPLSCGDERGGVDDQLPIPRTPVRGPVEVYQALEMERELQGHQGEGLSPTPEGDWAPSWALFR